ncbi:MAG: hypothetical protein KDN18_02225, partial [Verrucomicrobiae bacterium]|nr:hypothetical protein [Verrucomicrobiae bacterium]
QLERAREAERAQQTQRVRDAEQAEVDLSERPEPANREDFRSKIQSLTAQLESAMREISRLSAFVARESPRPIEMNGQSAGPANPIQPMASSCEELATQRSGNLEGKGIPTGQERALCEEDREEVRAESRNPPPLPRQNAENEVAFGIYRKPPILSTAQLRQQLEAARLAGKRFAGNVARLCGDNARPIE